MDAVESNREAQRRWYRAHPEAKRQRELGYRSRRAWRDDGRRFGEKPEFEVWDRVWHGPCFSCGVEPAEGVDHIVRRRHGGRNVESNLQPSCKPCNMLKG